MKTFSDIQRLGALLGFALVLLWTVPAATAQSRAELDTRVDEVLAGMTLEQKVGEMTQLTLQAVSATAASDETTEHTLDRAELREAVVERHVGSLLNVWDVAFTPEHWAEVITAIDALAQERETGVPVLYGIDAVHGHHYMQGATVFPHNLALAATFDPELAREAGRATAVEMRASGIPWNFSPVFDLGRQPLWSRFFETFGEDVHLVTEMGVATVEGMQGDDLSAPGRVAATGKHFYGYSAPRTGKDRTPAWLPEHVQREYYLAPFKAAIDRAGLASLMVNSGSINGVPVHGDPAILTALLRDEMGYEGVVVTDWADVDKLVSHHHVAADLREATKMVVLAGVDLAMVPYDYSFTDHLLALVRDGEIPESRLDESVRRILRLKMELGLFEDAGPDEALVAEIGSPAHRAASRRAAEEAITLLENDGTLPLAAGTRVLVTGPAADDAIIQHGSWTYSWQGTVAGMYPDTARTVLTSIRDLAGDENVTFVPGASLTEPLDVDAAADAARQSEVAVVVLGEWPSTEQPGDIETLDMPAAQQDLARAVTATGTPTVIVLLENRPLILRDLVDDAAAVVMAYQTGPYAGDAVAGVLWGEINPSGRLPFTYPRFPNSLVTYDHTASEETGPHGVNPQWPFGHGLSYTTFETTSLRLDRETASAADAVEVSVDVANTGDREGDEVVMVFVRDLVASIEPPVKRLRAFRKVTLAPGETQTVEFSIPVQDLAFVDRTGEWVVEPGTFEVQVGEERATFEVPASGTD